MVTMAKDDQGKVMKDHLFQFLEERYDNRVAEMVIKDHLFLFQGER